MLAPFLAHYLKGTGSAPVTEALTFRTGTNEWVQHDTWPPRANVADRKLYLQRRPQALLRSAAGDRRAGVRQLRVGSGESGAVSSAADQA